MGYMMIYLAESLSDKFQNQRFYCEISREYDQNINNKVVEHHLVRRKTYIEQADKSNIHLNKQKYPKSIQGISGEK